MDTLAVEIHDRVHFWVGEEGVRSPRARGAPARGGQAESHSAVTFTRRQAGAGGALVLAVDKVVQVALGRSHHADARACAQRVEVAPVVVAHRVSILHDGRATGGTTEGAGESPGSFPHRPLLGVCSSEPSRALAWDLDLGSGTQSRFLCLRDREKRELPREERGLSRCTVRGDAGRLPRSPPVCHCPGPPRAPNLTSPILAGRTARRAGNLTSASTCHSRYPSWCWGTQGPLAE